MEGCTVRTRQYLVVIYIKCSIFIQIPEYWIIEILSLFLSVRAGSISASNSSIDLPVLPNSYSILQSLGQKIRVYLLNN